MTRHSCSVRLSPLNAALGGAGISADTSDVQLVHGTAELSQTIIEKNSVPHAYMSLSFENSDHCGETVARTCQTDISI